MTLSFITSNVISANGSLFIVNTVKRLLIKSMRSRHCLLELNDLTTYVCQPLARAYAFASV
jgi:hypothetical protein